MSFRQRHQFNNSLVQNGSPVPIGADVIQHLISVRNPILMVDRITEYGPQGLSAERFVSANEPVFVGHFPDLKLWPGVYTIEGLRQCCELFDVLCRLDETCTLEGLHELQNRYMMRPRVHDSECRRVLDVIEELPRPEPFPLTLRMKLLAPVFAGCVIQYQVRQRMPGSLTWAVRAEVNGQSIAEGEIGWQPRAS